MSPTKQKILITIFAALFLAAPFFVSAAGLVPCGSNGENPCTVTDIFVLIARVTNYLIAMGAIFAVYQIINAGFNLIIFANGNEESITKNKSAITSAVVGFVLTLMAFMIINTVVNVLLTRSLVTGRNPNCRLNLTSPLTYLSIDPTACSNQPEPGVHIQ